MIWIQKAGRVELVADSLVSSSSILLITVRPASASRRRIVDDDYDSNSETTIPTDYVRAMRPALNETANSV